MSHLKMAKGNPVNFFVVSSICLFTARTIWSSHETHHAVHSQKLCVDTATGPCLGNPGFESWQGKKSFLPKMSRLALRPTSLHSIGGRWSFTRCNVVEVCFHGAHMKKKHFLAE